MLSICNIALCNIQSNYSVTQIMKCCPYYTRKIKTTTFFYFKKMIKQEI